MLCHVRCWRSSRKKQSRSAARISSNSMAASLHRWSATSRRPRSNCRSRSRSLGNPMPPSLSPSSLSPGSPSACCSTALSGSSALPRRPPPTPKPTASRPPTNTTAAHRQTAADQTPLRRIGRIRLAPQRERFITPNHHNGPGCRPETIASFIVSQPTNSAGEAFATGQNAAQTAIFLHNHRRNPDFPGLKPYFWVAFSFPESLIGLAFGICAGLRFAVGNYRTQFFLAFWR